MTPSITPRTILVVDDSPLVLELARLALESAGWHVECHESGTGALSRHTEETPDAVLLDVEMPEMDGPATLARIRTDPRLRHVPVVFLTGHQDRSMVQQLASHDVRGVLAKPFEVDDLPSDLADMLGWNR